MTIYDDRRKMLEDLEMGDVIKYYGGEDLGECYIVVYGVKEGAVFGERARAVKVYSLSMDELVKGGVEKVGSWAHK